MSNVKLYTFCVKQYGEIKFKVNLYSDHPHESDFIRMARRGIAEIYEIEEDDVILDVSTAASESAKRFTQ